MRVEATGKSSGIVRKIKMKLDIAKDASVMNYALAGRGRMWITGDTTIHGSIYSSWNNSSLSPFNMTSDSSIEGTINTVMAKNTVINQSWQLETLDDSGNPMFDEDGNRIYSADDKIQGYHEGINYGQPDQTNIPGRRIGDYNTSVYKSAIPTTTRSGTASVIANGVLGKTGVSTVTEYFRVEHPSLVAGLGRRERVAVPQTMTLLHRRPDEDRAVPLLKIGHAVQTGQRLSVYGNTDYVTSPTTGKLVALSPVTGNFGRSQTAVTIAADPQENFAEEFAAARSLLL